MAEQTEQVNVSNPVEANRLQIEWLNNKVAICYCSVSVGQ